MRRIVLPTVAAFVWLAASAWAGAPEPSSGCSGPPAAHRFTASFTVDGVQRSALVNLPPSTVPGKPAPLVLMFHGAGGDGGGTEATTGITGAANRYGFITVYPNANGKYWNVSGGGPTGEDDVTFIRSLVDQLDGVLCIDDGRIYAVGGSNGGGFVARLACELNDRLAAFASVAGLYGPQPACQPERPLPVLEIHGTADPTVPYTGWSARGIASVATFLGKWAHWDSCPRRPAVWSRLALRTLLQSRTGCADGTSVEHVKLLGEPHAWPSAHASSGVQFGAAQAVMRFFATGSVK